MSNMARLGGFRGAVRQRMPAAGVVRATAGALAVGAVGGAVFAYAQLPLAWMIGAMVATCIVSVAGGSFTVPKPLRSAMIMILGVLLGSAFRPSLIDELDRWAITLAALVPYIAIATMVGMLYLRRVARLDPTTAYFTSAPGGLSEMMIVGGENGGDERTIGLSHSARVMLVVFTVPFWFQFTVGYDPDTASAVSRPEVLPGAVDAVLLAACAIGWPVAKMLRFPAPALSGPMVLSAVVHLSGLTAAAPPWVLVAMAQVVVGSAVGCRFAGVSPREVARVAVLALGLTTLLLAVAVVFAVLLHRLTGIGLVNLILAFAPGGLAEMSLVALALGADAAFVSSHHIMRILLIVGREQIGRAHV